MGLIIAVLSCFVKAFFAGGQILNAVKKDVRIPSHKTVKAGANPATTPLVSHPDIADPVAVRMGVRVPNRVVVLAGHTQVLLLNTKGPHNRFLLSIGSCH